jgi:hypothetical protein
MSSSWEQETLYAEHKAEIDRTLRLLWVLWAGCLGEPIVLIVLAYVLGGTVRESVRPGDGLPIERMRAAFLGIALLVLVVSGVLRRHLLSSRFKGFKTVAGRSGVAPSVPLLGAEYMRRVCPSMVLAATPAILGFVLLLLGDSPAVFHLFVVPAILAALWHRPKPDELISLAGQLEQAAQNHPGEITE